MTRRHSNRPIEPPPNVSISTLRLRVPANDVASGRRIGLAVAEQLAARVGELRGAPSDTMRVRVDAPASIGPSSLARSIADRIVTRGRKP